MNFFRFDIKNWQTIWNMENTHRKFHEKILRDLYFLCFEYFDKWSKERSSVLWFIEGTTLTVIMGPWASIESPVWWDFYLFLTYKFEFSHDSLLLRPLTLIPHGSRECYPAASLALSPFILVPLTNFILVPYPQREILKFWIIGQTYFCPHHTPKSTYASQIYCCASSLA